MEKLNKHIFQMKKLIGVFVFTLFSAISFAQEEDIQISIDSLERTFTYQYGKVSLKDGIGEIAVPKGFKYLDIEQAEHVLVDLWGNPAGEGLTLGFIMPENQGVLSENGYVFNIEYEEIGYVEDDDADDIDYKELLAGIIKDTETESNERVQMGYEPVRIVGWAAEPYYDKNRKILHWAKEIQFGESEVNTLNYNIRILGRKGVLVLNAISSMPELSAVKKDIPHVLNIVQFNEGYRYEDFNPSVDEVAAWTIGGLVAGKLLAKAGFFALIIKFWKFIALGVVGLFSVIIKKFKGRKDHEPEDDEADMLKPASEL